MTPPRAVHLAERVDFEVEQRVAIKGDHYAAVRDPRRARETWEALLSAVRADRPDTSDLRNANLLSRLQARLAGLR
jgi:hypothetical protein